MGILDGKIAIVTGASKGLGRAEAVALAKEGAAVTIVARTESTLEGVADEIRALGARVLAVPCDVAVRDDVKNVVARTIAEFGDIDILVNNAQVIPQPIPFEEWPEDLFRACWESGALGTWLFMVECYPYLKDKEYGGRIINTASGAGVAYIEGYTGYASAKEAIRSLTRQAAHEWGPKNICVNCICPAALSPGAIESMDKDPETKEFILNMITMHKFGREEEDVGRTVVFLAGPDASYLTGNTISVDGGATICV